MNVLILKTVKIRSYEAGLYFRDGEFMGLLGEGRHWFADPLGKVRVEVVSQRHPWLTHEKLDMIVRSGKLEGRAEVVDLKDEQRGLVWIDGRFDRVLAPGLYAYWKGQKQVKVEVVDTAGVRFEHKELALIARSASAAGLLDVCRVEQNRVGVLFYDGRYVGTLQPGLYAFWKGAAHARLVEHDMRETMVELGGQEIMTADKVTLRLNAVMTCRVVDAQRVVTSIDDHRQAIYREAQLALRAAARRVPGRQGCPGPGNRANVARPGRAVGCRDRLGRYPRCDFAGRHEGADEPRHRGEEGGRGQPDRPTRGNGRHAQPVQHGQVVGE